jgi:hypothetical protein
MSKKDKYATLEETKAGTFANIYQNGTHFEKKILNHMKPCSS